MKIAVALFDGAEELDWAGPWEVLSAWASVWPDDGVEVFTVADRKEPIECAKGLRVLADHTWDAAPALDVLVYPGGRGTRRECKNEVVLERLRHLSQRGTLMTTVCTGSLVFAIAGLLDGRPATTWWGALDMLAAAGTNVDIQPNARFVDDGDIITAAGVFGVVTCVFIVLLSSV